MTALSLCFLCCFSSLLVEKREIHPGNGGVPPLRSCVYGEWRKLISDLTLSRERQRAIFRLNTAFLHCVTRRPRAQEPNKPSLHVRWEYMYNDQEESTQMNRRKAIRSVAGAAVVAPLALGAGEEIADWVGWWERSKKYTMQIAEAMPETEYSYRPFRGSGAPADGVRSGDGARSFGELMQHIGQVEGFYLGRLGKGSAPVAPRNDTSKATTVRYLNDLFDWSINVIKQLTPADLKNPVSAGRGPAMTGLDALLNALVHTAHTRGYSDLYLRSKNVKPPTYSV
jgi:hypothetical protein